MKRTSSFRFSSRDCACGLLSACHIGRVAGLVEDQLGELGVLHAVDLAAPALEGGDEVGRATCAPCRASSSVSTISRAAWYSGIAARAGQLVHALDRGVAEAALGHVDDALELQVVGRIGVTSR